MLLASAASENDKTRILSIRTRVHSEFGLSERLTPPDHIPCLPAEQAPYDSVAGCCPTTRAPDALHDDAVSRRRGSIEREACQPPGESRKAKQLNARD